MNNKILIGIVVLIIIGGAIWLVQSALKEEPASPETKTLEFNGKLSLQPSSAQYKKGVVFPVDVTIDSAGQSIVGADIMIQYDPAILEVKAQNGDLVKTEKDFFAVFPADGQTEENLFQFSVLTQKPQILSGKIATIYFSAKEAGEAKLEFLFEEGKTNDSNLALFGEGTDILASVSNAVFQIVNSQ
jgi:hypothetical protein